MLFGYIQGGTLFPEPLTAEEERNCLEQMAKGDEEARNILIERNLRLVAHVAKKYTTAKVEQDDLISIYSTFAGFSHFLGGAFGMQLLNCEFLYYVKGKCQ